jgi:DNA-binding NarL/FixJ family response regulator
MNPLICNQNLFVLTTINPKEPDNPKLLVINEFEGFFEFVENELALHIFGAKDHSKKERIQLARNLLIKMIGQEEFMNLRNFFQFKDSDVVEEDQFTILDDTERLIFKLIAKGFSQNEIAELLDFTDSKVNLHQKQIFEKMNFAGKADLLEYAFKNKLV